MAQNFANLERTEDYMSKMEIRLSRESWKQAGARKTETARLTSLLHLGQMCHRIAPSRPSGRTDTLPYGPPPPPPPPHTHTRTHTAPHITPLAHTIFGYPFSVLGFACAHNHVSRGLVD